MGRDQDAEVLANTQQAAIEQPVEGACEREPIPHRVGTAGGHWADMRCLNLGPPTAVDQPQAGEGAGVLECILDSDFKRCLPEPVAFF